jgi:hypothetical protein
MDGVLEVVWLGGCLARSNDFRGSSVRRVAAVDWAKDVRRAAFSQGLGQGSAEVSVVLFESLDAFGGDLQPA